MNTIILITLALALIAILAKAVRFLFPLLLIAAVLYGIFKYLLPMIVFN